MLFWGISFVATKLALEAFSPTEYMLGRFALASVPFLVLLLSRGWPRLGTRIHLRLALIAIAEPGLYFFFEAEGLARTSAPKASIIIASLPVVVAIASRIVLGERMRPRAVIGAAVSIVGVAVLVLADPTVAGAAATVRVGDLLIGGAVLAATVYMLLVRSIAREVSSYQITSFQVLYGTLFFGLLFAVQPGDAFAGATGEAVGAIVFLAFFATIAAFFAYNYALSQIPAGRASIALNGIPVVTALTAWVLLGEVLGPLQILGGALVLFGVTLANLSRRAGGESRRREGTEPRPPAQHGRAKQNNGSGPSAPPGGPTPIPPA